MARPEKVAEVEYLTDKLLKSEGVVLADFSGLTVAQANDLRVKCREQKVELRVVKNRLARRAAVAADSAALEALFKGPTAIAFGLESPVEPAKVLTEFAKTNEKLRVKGGFVDGEVLSVKDVRTLSGPQSSRAHRDDRPRHQRSGHRTRGHGQRGDEFVGPGHQRRSREERPGGGLTFHALTR